MVAAFSQVLISPPTLLWLVFSLIAAMLLFSGLHHRRARLTEALRTFVRRHQDEIRKPETLDQPEND